MRPTRHAARALLSYAVLVVGFLRAQLVVAGWLDGHAGWIASPAVWLLVTCALTPILVPMTTQAPRQAVSVAARRWWPVGAATVVFLALGGVLR